MYADPKYIRKHPCKVNFNDEEKALVDLAARRNGMQTSTFVHDVIMESLEIMLAAEKEDSRRSA